MRQQAQASVEEVARALGEYTEAIDRAIAQYTAQIDQEVHKLQQRIDQLITQKERTVRDLRVQSEAQIGKLTEIKSDLEREVQAALEEIERTLIEDSPQLVSYYSPVLRELTKTSQFFRLFSFHIQTSSQPTVTIKTHFSQDIHAVELAHITPRSIRFFNCQTSTWGPQIRLDAQIQVDHRSQWVILKDGRLFCSGELGVYLANSSGRLKKVAYLLGRDGTVAQLPDMITGRCEHGIIQVGDLYVFGGRKL